MKWNSIKSAIAAVVVGGTAIVAASAHVSASQEKALKQSDFDRSAIKPVIDVTKEVISLDEAQASPTRKVTVKLSGGTSCEWGTLGLHVYYDKRTSTSLNPFGAPDVKKGVGTSYMNLNVQDDPTAVDQDMNGFFVAAASAGNNGMDGDLFTFDINLPADVAEGDVFPIDIIYKSNNNCEDLFLDASRKNKAMQGYLFTRGIYNDTTNPYEGDEYLPEGSSYDGYIAIDSSKVPDGGISQVEVDQCEEKPSIEVSKEVISISDAVQNPEREVTLTLHGNVEGRWATSGMHIYYDSRLQVVANPFGEPDVKKGDATKYLSVSTKNDESADEEDGMSGFFITTAAAGNSGMEGQMYTFKFILPPDVEVGDVYPIDIRYKSNANASDLFIDAARSRKLMQSYLFTRGIYNEDLNPYPGDAYLPAGSSYDGYIAIESNNADLG